MSSILFHWLGLKSPASNVDCDLNFFFTYVHHCYVHLQPAYATDKTTVDDTM